VHILKNFFAAKKSRRSKELQWEDENQREIMLQREALRDMRNNQRLVGWRILVGVFYVRFIDICTIVDSLLGLKSKSRVKRPRKQCKSSKLG
jgi:hypothetical protein